MMFRNLFSKQIPASEVYRQFYGNPNQITLSSDGYKRVSDIFDNNGRGYWFASDDQRRGLLYAMAKEAELCERFGIPLSRVFDEDMHIIPPRNNLPGGYDPKDDAIMIRGKNTGDLGAILRYLQTIYSHENKHRMLARPIGMDIADQLRNKHKFSSTAVPYQPGDRNRKILADDGSGKTTLIYKDLFEQGIPFYGTEDFDLGYPTELLSSMTTDIIYPDWQADHGASNQLISRSGVAMLRKALKRMAAKGKAEQPNIRKELKIRMSYTPQQKIAVKDKVIQSMKKLAQTKEVIRNQLGIYQNQALGLAKLSTYPNGTLQQADNMGIMRNFADLGIPLPDVFHGNARDMLQSIKFPVSRSVDPIMHQLIDDPQLKKINGGWNTPPISWK